MLLQCEPGWLGWRKFWTRRLPRRRFSRWQCSSCRNRRGSCTSAETIPAGRSTWWRRTTTWRCPGCSPRPCAIWSRGRRTIVSKRMGTTSCSCRRCPQEIGSNRASCKSSGGSSRSPRAVVRGRGRPGGCGSRRGVCSTGFGTGGSDEPRARPHAEAAHAAAQANFGSGQSLDAKDSVGPSQCSARRLGQRQRRIQQRIKRRQGLCCQGTLLETDRGGEDRGGTHPPQCPDGARSSRVPRRTCVAETVPRTTHSSWGSQDHGSDRVSCGLGLGAGHREGQLADASLLCSSSFLRRTELPGQWSNSSFLASHRGCRAELPVDGSAQEEAFVKSFCPAPAGDMGCSKCLLPERYRHVREQIEKPGRRGHPPSSSRGGKGRQGAEKNKEVEGRKGRRHQCRRQLPCMSDSRGPPEQRSGDCQSSEGKIDSETYSGLNPDLNSNGFDSFIDYTPSSMIDPVTVLLTSLQWLERVPCSFNIFMSRSFRAVRESRTVEGPMHHRSLWPVPPPLWRWTANPRPGPRQRRRRRKARACHLLLQRLVCMLNWITLGYPDKPTPAARAGGTCSADQYKVLQNLQQQIDHFSDVAAFASQDLGRFGEKFSALKRSSEELPAHLEVDLEDLLHEIHSSLNHYTRFEKPHFADREQFSQQHAECKHEPSNVVSDSVGNKPVIASRIKWKHPPSFDARPYLLDPVVASVYERPDTLRLPASEWPQKSKARVHCERGELKEMMKIWDAHGSLALFPTSEVDEQETVGLFAVPKDSEYDRLIVNPTVLNSRMAGYSNFTKKLAPGSLIALLSLEPDQCFRFNADDLSDFYYTFRVSRARAKRNAIGVRMFEKDVAGLSCYDPKTPGPYYPALATLAMGDGHAVEIAQGSHHALLQIEAGSMLDSESLEYRKPIPRGDFIELLAIDDHIGIQRVSHDQLISKTPLRDTEVFDRATSAYSRVGLVSHPGKQKRYQTQGTILGADFDGVRGIVSAPRSRIHLLCLVTSLICSKGTCTRHLLNSLVGCWIHIILFRRPLLALMDAVFREGMNNKPHEVFCLSSQLRHELMSLCLLAPCAQADLRAAFCPRIYAMDASPWGGGIVYADSTSKATAELWRHSEQRGYHTNLLSPAAGTLEELGFDSSGALAFGAPPNEHDNPPKPSHRIPRSLQEGIIFDCVELFRGSGNWSQCHADIGLRVHDGFDNSGHRLFFKDLSDNATFREVISLALRRVVREFHAGPPCMTFGTLRRPRLRSVSQPEGFDPTDPLTALHNSLARRTAMIGAIAVLTGAYFGCEQTGSSVMFRMHCFKVLIRLGCIITRMAFCNFGSGFNKPSQWLHNKGWLVEFEGNCQCKHKGKHFTIEGNFTERSMLEFESRCVPNSSAVYGRKPRPSESVASYSAQYPVSLMRRMALGSLTALKEGPPIIPQQCRVLSMKRVGDHEEIPDSVFSLLTKKCLLETGSRILSGSVNLQIHCHSRLCSSTSLKRVTT